MRASVIVALAAAGLLVFGACSGGSGSGGSGADVSMTNAQVFEPQEFTIRAGESVTWGNDSSEAHTVTAFEDGVPEGAAYFASGDFSSESDARSNVGDGLIGAGETFEVTFDEPGTYRYFCIPHEAAGMEGTVIVEP